MVHSSLTEIIQDEAGEAVGVMLGADYCAEHEWGIKGLLRAFQGMVPEEAERDRVCDFRRIRVKPPEERLVWHEERQLAILATIRDRQHVESQHRQMGEADFKKLGLKPDAPFARVFLALQREIWIPKVPREPSRKAAGGRRATYEEPRTCSAWDGNSFSIATRDQALINLLRDLHEALVAGDAVMHLSSSGNPFKLINGLVLAIESRVPQAEKDAFKAAHEERYLLQDAAKATGIEARLGAAGKGFFALSPAWSTSIKSTRSGEIKTAHPVIFFLNPRDQRGSNSGWFTVEALDLWIKGEGPIPKR